jgi:hypothetical protein
MLNLIIGLPPLKVGVSYPFDIVASDIDIHALYKYLCQILLLKATSTRKI